MPSRLGFASRRTRGSRRTRFVPTSHAGVRARRTSAACGRRSSVTATASSTRSLSPAKGQDAGLHRPGRRPLPHADDAHARDDRDRARRRAGAASERGPDRGDRARPRHGPPPFGHVGEEALDECLRERFGLGFRHNEQSLRIAGVAQPHLGGARRDPQAHGRGRAGDARGQDRAHRRPGRVHQPRHRRRRPARILDPEDLPQDEVALLGPSGSKRIDTLVHDLVESSEAAGDVVQGEEVGAAMLSLRGFMFERVYLGPHTCRSTSAPARPSARSSSTWPIVATSRTRSSTISPA